MDLIACPDGVAVVVGFRYKLLTKVRLESDGSPNSTSFASTSGMTESLKSSSESETEEEILIVSRRTTPGLAEVVSV